VIVVDTSVWIAAQRRPYIDRTLQSLLEADEVALALPVRLELWAGVARQDRKAHRAAFGALPQLVPTDETWQPLTEWIAKAADAGERFTVTDLLIASLTADIGGLVWSLDKDFERMETLGFVSRYDPPDVD
jgi:predicted nucleic acid-binding protein